MPYKKKEIYCYKNGEFIAKYQSVTEAADKTNCDPNQVSRMARGLTKSPVTKQGYAFSLKPLTDEEIAALPYVEEQPSSGYVKVDEKKCVQKVKNQEYEVPCQSKLVLFQSRNKAQRKEDFKTFLYTVLRDRWCLIPEKISTLEQQMIKEFLESV